MTDHDYRKLLENEHFSLAQADFCNVPGYLILRFTARAESFSQLDEATAGALGGLLARVTRTLEQITGAERVYSLSFCEVDRRLHLHLFPRTAALLAEYQADTGTQDQPANGALLFEWARARYAAQPTDAPDAVVVRACERLAEALKT